MYLTLSSKVTWLRGRAGGSAYPTSIALTRGSHLPLVLAHEMGHVALGHNTDKGNALWRKDKFAGEVAAWQWAVSRRSKPLTKQERLAIRLYLASYLGPPYIETLIAHPEARP